MSRLKKPLTASSDYNPPGDSPYVDTDLAEKFFGDKGIIAEEGDDYTIPADIQECFELHGLKNRHFSVILKHMPEGTSTSTGHYVTGWRDKIPTIDWIAKNYGPGTYHLVFQWKEMIDGERDKRKSVTDTLPVEISEKYAPVYKQHQLKQRIKHMQEQKDLLKEAQIDNLIDETVNSEGLSLARKNESKQTAKEYVSEVMDFAKSLGLTNQGRGTDWSQILSIALPLVPAFLRYMDDRSKLERERQDKFLMLLMNNTQSNASQLVELSKIRSGNQSQSGTQMMEEFGKMIFSALDIKEALTGGKESTVDKIFSMIEKTLPLIGMFAAMPKQQRMSSPQFAAAQAYIGNDQEFQAVMNNPEQLTALIRRLDSHYGWEQTDNILNVVQIERPETAQRYQEQQYPAGDSRNEAETETETETDTECVEAQMKI